MGDCASQTPCFKGSLLSLTPPSKYPRSATVDSQKCLEDRLQQIKMF